MTDKTERPYKDTAAKLETFEPLWNKRQLAEFLNVSVPTLDRLRKTGRRPFIPEVKIGNQIRWRVEDVDTWLRQCRELNEELDQIEKEEKNGECQTSQ